MKGGVVMRIDRIKLISEMARQSIKVNDLAKKAGVSANTISGIRNGKSCINAIGEAIANALEVDINDLTENQ